MRDILGQLLPIAAGIAISPIPISAAILLLLGPRAARNGTTFLVGWLLGVFIPVSLATTILAGLNPTDAQGPKPAKGTAMLLLGAACLFFAWRIWRRRPAPGVAAPEPRWMQAIDRATPIKALVLGLALSMLNPEDLLLALSGGVVIGSQMTSFSQGAWSVALFTLFASSTVIVPIVVYAVARSRVADSLTRLKAWLIQNNAMVMSALLLVIGTAVIGNGISAF